MIYHFLLFWRKIENMSTITLEFKKSNSLERIDAYVSIF